MWSSIGMTTTPQVPPANALKKKQPKQTSSEEESEDTSDESGTVDSEDDDTSYYMDKVENLVLSFLTEFLHFQSYEPLDALNAEIPFLCNLRRKLQLMNHVMRKFESKLQKFLKVQILHDLIELTKDPRNGRASLKPWIKLKELVLQFSDKIKNPQHSKKTPEIRGKILSKLIADLKPSPNNLEDNSGSESSPELQEARATRGGHLNTVLNQISGQNGSSSPPPSELVDPKKFAQSPQGKTSQLDFSYYPFPPFSTKALEIFARVKLEDAADQTPTVPPPSRQPSCCSPRGMFGSLGYERKLNPEAVTKEIPIKRDRISTARPFQVQKPPTTFVVPSTATIERERLSYRAPAWNGVAFDTNPVRTPVFGATVKKSLAACPWFRLPTPLDKSDCANPASKESSKTLETHKETAYAGSCHPSRRFGFMTALDPSGDSKQNSVFESSTPNTPTWNHRNISQTQDDTITRILSQMTAENANQSRKTGPQNLSQMSTPNVNQPQKTLSPTNPSQGSMPNLNQPRKALPKTNPSQGSAPNLNQSRRTLVPTNPPQGSTPNVNQPPKSVVPTNPSTVSMQNASQPRKTQGPINQSQASTQNVVGQSRKTLSPNPSQMPTQNVNNPRKTFTLNQSQILRPRHNWYTSNAPKFETSFNSSKFSVQKPDTN